MSKNKQKKGNLKKFGRGLYKVIDKLIVTPISRVLYRLGKIVKSNSGFLEGILNRRYSLLLISLFIAVVGFLLVDGRANNLVETESEILTGQPVNVIYNEEKYVVEGVPETVDIILMGRKSDLYLAKQLGEHKIVLDLSDYKIGEYTVKLKYNHSVEAVTYKLDPSSVRVKISEKVSSSRTLSYDLLNQDKIDSKLNVSGVKLKESEVYVKGSKETLEKVASVKALIDVAKLDLTESGSIDVDKLPIVAYDENGKIVENVEVVPSTASATLTIDSYYKDLPVKVVPIGTMATGYSISSAASSLTNVRVYGDQESIDNISYISAEIDVEGLNTDKKYIATLTKPAGVRFVNASTSNIEVKVGPEVTREIEGISVEQRNLGSSYVAGSLSESDTKCTIILKGAENIIKDIDAKSISAYVDLSGYTPGTYDDVPIEVEGQDLTVTYTAKVKTISIRISNKR